MPDSQHLTQPSLQDHLLHYRRFGRTGLSMPIFSTGGMRYQQSWQDLAAAAIAQENQDNLAATIRRSLALGLNHIETARAYGTSELQLGPVLAEFPRADLILQTKVVPKPDPEEFEANLRRSLELLRTDYVDLFSLHGINTPEILEWCVRPGGCLAIAQRYQRLGQIRFIGFSTHGPTPVIVEAIETDAFDYVNLHWYYINQQNWPAIQAANRHDMGVFIISPSDKGGHLYNPPAKLVELCQPLSPMVFNNLFCLSYGPTGQCLDAPPRDWLRQAPTDRPANHSQESRSQESRNQESKSQESRSQESRSQHPVHTLSIGAARPSDFDEHLKVLPWLDQASQVLPPILERLHQAAIATLGEAWVNHWRTGLPEHHQTPGNINIPVILWLRNLALAYDMLDYAKARYNLLENAGHWFPGARADRVEAVDLSDCLRLSPFRDRIPTLLLETHQLLSGKTVKRLSQSE